MNGCEPRLKRHYILADESCKRWFLGRAFTVDSVVAAGEMLNDTPMPRSINKALHTATP